MEVQELKRNLKDDMKYTLATILGWVQIETCAYGERCANSEATNECLNHIMRIAKSNHDGCQQVADYFSMLGLAHNNGRMSDYLDWKREGRNGDGMGRHAERCDAIFSDFVLPYEVIDAIRTTGLEEVYGREQVSDAFNHPLPMSLLIRKYWTGGQQVNHYRTACECGGKKTGAIMQNIVACWGCKGMGVVDEVDWDAYYNLTQEEQWNTPYPRREVTCHTCKGSGWKEERRVDTCSHCYNTGVIEHTTYGNPNIGIKGGHGQNTVDNNRNERLERHGNSITKLIASGDMVYTVYDEYEDDDYWDEDDDEESYCHDCDNYESSCTCCGDCGYCGCENCYPESEGACNNLLCGECYPTTSDLDEFHYQVQVYNMGNAYPASTVFDNPHDALEMVGRVFGDKLCTIPGGHTLVGMGVPLLSNPHAWDLTGGTFDHKTGAAVYLRIVPKDSLY